jgi:hypothetical protein
MWMGIALAGCGQPVVTGYEAEIVTISEFPFGLTADDRLSTVTGSFTWHTANLDSDPRDDVGEYNHPGDGDFRAVLPNGVVLDGSGYSQVRIVGNTTIDVFDGSDGWSQGRPMQIDGTESESISLSMLLVNNNPVFSDDRLPTAFPDLNHENWTHTFALRDAGGTALLQLTRLSDQTPE